MVHNLDGKRHGFIYIGTGIFIGAVGFALLNIIPASAMAAILVVVLITFSEMLSMPFMNSFWISRTTPYNRGEYAALYTMAWSAAQVVAPFAGSQIIYFGGFKLLWWLLVVISCISASGFLLLYFYKIKPAQKTRSEVFETLDA
jgi:MFS family permease